MDIAQFRLDFPEFSDSARYPSSMITFWSDLGEETISESRFGSVWVKVVELFTAHNITLAVQNIEMSSSGGSPGSSSVVQSKSVGSVSVSYDTGNASSPDAGQWNLTVYGKQYIQLVRLYGGGCYQL